MPSKQLEAKDIVGFYISSILGAGILVVPGIAAQLAGPSSLLAWTILLVCSIPVALTFTVIAGRYPGNGGITTIINAGFGSLIGKSSCLMICIIMVIGNPFSGLAAASYFSELIPVGNDWGFIAVAYIFLLLSVIYNFLPLTSSAKSQNLLTIGIISILLLVCILSVPNIDTHRLEPFMPFGWSGVGAATVVGFFSFLGWENVVSISKEVKDPIKNFQKAFFIALLIIALLYLMLAFFVVTAVSKSEISEKITIVSYLIPSDRYGYANHFGALFAMLIIVVSNNAWVMGAARLVQSLSSQGLLPNRFSTVTKNGVPVYALFGLAFGYGITLIGYQYLKLNEAQLISIVNGMFVIIYALSFSAGLILFKSTYEKFLVICSLVITIIFSFLVGLILIPIVLTFFSLVFIVFCKDRANLLNKN